MEMPAPASPDRVRRIKVWTPDELGRGGQYRVILPPWGYLEGVEMRLRELVPNMDASRPLSLSLGIGDGWHLPMPMDVMAVVRDVQDFGSPGPDPWTDAARLGDTALTCPACGENLRGHVELAARRAE